MGNVEGYLIPLKFLGSPRETEADFRGIRYMQKAGYNPRALVAFLEKMQTREKTEPNSVTKMFLTHPPTTERIRMLQQRVGTTLYVDPNKATAGELQKIKALLRSVTSKPEADKADPK
jgi:beta-barrel assembly-enhancing protease